MTVTPDNLCCFPVTPDSMRCLPNDNDYWYACDPFQWHLMCWFCCPILFLSVQTHINTTRLSVGFVVQTCFCLSKHISTPQAWVLVLLSRLVFVCPNTYQHLKLERWLSCPDLFCLSKHILTPQAWVLVLLSRFIFVCPSSYQHHMLECWFCCPDLFLSVQAHSTESLSVGFVVQTCFCLSKPIISTPHVWVLLYCPDLFLSVQAIIKIGVCESFCLCSN